MDQQVMQQRPAARPRATPPGKRMAGPNHARLTQFASVLNGGAAAQRAPNRTGLPDGLKAGVEALSGISMDHVRVHYNSAKPAQLNAHAYAQGSDIHLAPGQQRHLPHEAWHVVQQAQGRVKPTLQMNSGVSVNDDAGLELEADAMGAKALGPIHDVNGTSETKGNLQTVAPAMGVVQGIEIEVLPDDHQPAPGEKVATPDRIEEPDDEPAPEINDKPALENEEAENSSEALYNVLAIGLLAAVIAWQKYRARTGHQLKGRGAHAVEHLFSQMDVTTRELGSLVESVNEAKAIYRYPFIQGFRAGVDPWPMPVAEKYAPWNELQSTFHRVLFLSFAGRDSLAEYQDRVRRFALRSAAAKHGDESEDSNTTSSAVMDQTMRVRSDLQIGFGMGAAGSSIVLGNLPILSSPVMALQMPWDAFHVLNAVAIRSMEARKNADLMQRKLITYNMRILNVMGQKQLNKTFTMNRLGFFLLKKVKK